MNKLLFISLFLVFGIFINCYAEIEGSLVKTEYDSKNYDKAANNYKKTIDILEKLIKDYNQSAIFYFKKGKQEKSTEFYRKIHKLNLKLAKIYLGLGIIYSQNQSYEKALEFYKKSYFLFPANKDEVCQFLEDMYEKIDSKKQVSLFYKKSCEGDLQYWNKNLYLRNNYSSSHDSSQALDYYLNLYKGDFNSTYLAKAFYELGNKCREEENCAKAVKYFKKAIDYKPTYIRPYIALANYFQENKQYNKAIKYLKAVRKINPNNISISFNLGKNYIRIGQKEEAFREIEKLRQLGRDDLADDLIAEIIK
ncbi:MAG: hypothetical protein K9L61_00140 [Candidatus Omnitrophica bacterium]|nr:hypothetical protein [Candidatus Omnitrophota bacterium]